MGMEIDLTLDVEHMIQYADEVLQNCMPETYNFITNFTLVHSIKIKNKYIKSKDARG